MKTKAQKIQPIVRVLAIPHGKDTDADGRKVGSDWLLADMGVHHDGAHYYVTTNYIPASEVGAFPIFDPDKLSKYLVDQVNASWRRNRRKMAEKTNH